MRHFNNIEDLETFIDECLNIDETIYSTDDKIEIFKDMIIDFEASGDYSTSLYNMIYDSIDYLKSILRDEKLYKLGI